MKLYCMYVLRFLLHIFTQPIIFSFKCSKMFFISEEQIENRSEVIFSHFSITLYFIIPNFAEFPIINSSAGRFRCQFVDAHCVITSYFHSQEVLQLTGAFQTQNTIREDKYIRWKCATCHFSLFLFTINVEALRWYKMQSSIECCANYHTGRANKYFSVSSKLLCPIRHTLLSNYPFLCKGVYSLRNTRPLFLKYFFVALG